MNSAVPGDGFKNRCTWAARVLAGCVGYDVERISFSTSGYEDALEICFTRDPSRPDVIVQLAGVYHFSISASGDLHGCDVDAISLIHLPTSPLPWPDGIWEHVPRFECRHELAWLQVIGPMSLDVVAARVTVYSAASQDEASAAREG